MSWLDDTGYGAAYREAVEHEQFVRDRAFLPVTERIGDFEVLPMTLEHWAALRLVRSPFVCGWESTPEDAPEVAADEAAAFLWLLSPDYSPRDRRARARLVRRCRKFSVPKLPLVHFPWLMRRWQRRTVRRLEALVEIIGQIEKFLADTFQDLPGSKPSDGPSYYSFVASIVDDFGTEYGWTAQGTARNPLKQSFQLLKIIKARRAAKANRTPIMFNPSDAIRSKALETLNRN